MLVDAGWYGLTGYLFKKEFPDSKVLCSDIDPITRKYGKYLFDELDFVIANAILDEKYCDVYINTSIEHIERHSVEYILSKIKNDTVVALQSNDYYEHMTHVNCSPNLEEFEEYIGKHLRSILYAGELELNDFTRFMVIGIK